MCVLDFVKDLNVKVFNLMLEQHETCKCKFGLDASVCNNEQRWDVDECKCECKELTDEGVCDKGSIWNHTNCKCECNKSCDAGEHLDYENCKCKKKFVDKLVQECTENIHEVKMAGENEHKNKCSSCTLCIMLLSIILTIIIRIGIYLVYYKYMNRNKEKVSRYNHVYQATSY